MCTSVHLQDTSPAIPSVGGSAMAKLMDNMPYSEFYKWLAFPTFTGPVGLIAKLYVKEVTI